MAIIKPRNHTAIDLYKAWCRKKVEEDPELSLGYDAFYKAHGLQVLYKGRVKKSNRIVKQGEIIMNYQLFRKIVETYNKTAIELVVEGESFQLGNKMGTIRGKRVGRNFNNKEIDFEATRLARQQEPGHPAIYRMDEDYCRVYWRKPKYITNESIYNFFIAITFKREFKEALKANPLLKYNYIYQPYIPSISKTA